MAGKITDLTAVTSLSSDDLIELVDDVGGTPASKKITWANVLSSISAALFGTNVSVTGNIVASGDVKGATFHVGADAGIDATVTTADLVGKTITIKKGIITGYS